MTPDSIAEDFDLSMGKGTVHADLVADDAFDPVIDQSVGWLVRDERV